MVGTIIFSVVLGWSANAHEWTRTQSAPLIVTTTADTGIGSLRWAITQANALIGPDSILFAIGPGDPGYSVSTGTWTIFPITPFPSISDGGLTIDGTSQARAVGGDPNPLGPEIEISGERLSPDNGLTIVAEGTQVRGLTINRCRYAGISFTGAKGGQVFGCYLGTTSTGERTVGNESGIHIGQGSRDIVIGELTDSTRGNLISGNHVGVFVQDWCVNISIIGNRIGTNRTGTDTLGNESQGICIQEGCDSTTVLNNLVGGNTDGIYCAGATHSFVSNNSVGTNDAWTINLANRSYGIQLTGSSQNNLVLANTVGNNMRAGIINFGQLCFRNRLSQNRISRNQETGIENALGGNIELLPPVILTVTFSSISGLAAPGNVVEVFADDSLQGMSFCGSTTAESTGAFTLLLSGPVTRRYVTATATDAEGNTSEFSAGYLVTSADGMTEDAAPAAYCLSQNYPNPFNPTTTIRYALPERSYLSLTVYNTLGQQVATLVEGEQEAGYHEVQFDASSLASGVYLYRLQAGDFVQARKLVVVK